MRLFFHWLGGIAVIAGMGVFGYQNPAVGVVLLFGGSALWLASQKGAVAVIRRFVMSIASRNVAETKISKRGEARAQFDSLSKAEREGLRIFWAHGTAMPDKVTTRLKAEGYAEPEKVVDSIRAKTSFLVGSFSGEVSVNPSMKDVLEELTEEPFLARPAFGYVGMALALAAVIGCGYLFYTKVYPGRKARLSSANPQPTQPEQSSLSDQSPKERPSGQTEGTKTSDLLAVEVRRGKTPVEFSFQSSGEKKQRITSTVFPTSIQVEPAPTEVQGTDLPKDVPVNGGTIAVLKFGQGYIEFDTHGLPIGTPIRGQILGYNERPKRSAASSPALPAPNVMPATTGNNSPPVGSVTQGSGSALSVNQQGGITVGTINLESPPLKLEWTANPLQPDEKFQYRETVNVTTNIVFQPVSLIVICDQEIKDITAMGLMYRADFAVTQQDNKIGYVYYESPALVPGVGLTITVSSTNPFSVLGVRQAVIKPRKNAADGPEN